MNTQIYRTIAWNLIQLRQSNELRQEDLAVKVGLSRYQISRIERGLGDITLDSVIKVADFFNIKVAKLCEVAVKKPRCQIGL